MFQIRRQTSMVLILAALVVLGFAGSAQAAAFVEPTAGTWITTQSPGNFVTVHADVPLAALDTTKLVVNGVGDAVGCSQPMDVSIVPAPVLPGSGPATFSCTWDTSGLADGPLTLELYVDTGLGPFPTPDDTVALTVDSTSPSTPSGIIDDSFIATGADLDVLRASGPSRVSWGAWGDDGPMGSGVGLGDWCVTSDSVWAAAPNDICTDVRSGSRTPPALTSVMGGPALSDGVTYYSCAKDFDLAGNGSLYACSDGFLADGTLPVAPASVLDMASGGSGDIDVVGAVGDFAPTWAAGSDATTSVTGYDWCINTTADCAGTPVRSGTSASAAATTAGAALPEGTYYTCVGSIDEAGNTSTAPTCSDGFTVDATAPTLPGAVRDDAATATGADVDALTSDAAFTIAWTAATDAPAGVASYEWCVSTSSSCASPLRSGTTTATSVSASGTALASGTTYRSCVRAVDTVGNASGYECSDGVTYTAPTPPTPTTPKSLCPTGSSGVTCVALTAALARANGCTMQDPSGLLITRTTPGTTGVFRVPGSESSDCIVLDAGYGSVGSGGGDDVIRVIDPSSSVTVSGGAGDDRIQFPSSAPTSRIGTFQLEGGAGDDTFVMGSPAAAGRTRTGRAVAKDLPMLIIRDRDGNNTVRLHGFGSFQVSLGAGNDSVLAMNVDDSGPHTVNAGDGRNVVSVTLAARPARTARAGGAAQPVRITTGSGRDVITGSSGVDVVRSGGGDDRIVAGAGNDVVDGGAGADTILGGDGNDQLTGGAGDDVIRPGAGRDLVQWQPGAEPEVR